MRNNIKYQLTYRLRRKGFRVISRQRTIMAGYLSDPFSMVQVRRLVNEFHYAVQFEMI